MGILNLLGEGFANILTDPHALLVALLGCLLGTVVGILPRPGPGDHHCPAHPRRAQPGPADRPHRGDRDLPRRDVRRHTDQRLLNIPGEPSSVMTAVDGYQLAKQGRAGAALAIAAIGSFIGGTLSVVAPMALAPPLANAALEFGPAQYFGVLVLALVLSASLVGESVFRGLISIMFGLVIATIGTDLQTGVPRFTSASPGCWKAST